MSTRLTKISDDNYEKPVDTYQDKLTQEDIQLLLEEYNQVTDMHELKPGLHVRYFSIIKKKVGKSTTEKRIFRMGGQIIKIDYEKQYLVLSNGKITWSVQINDSTIFYRKLTSQEIKDFYENEITEVDTELTKTRAAYEKLKGLYRELQAENDKLKSELSNFKKLLKKANIL